MCIVLILGVVASEQSRSDRHHKHLAAKPSGHPHEHEVAKRPTSWAFGRKNRADIRDDVKQPNLRAQTRLQGPATA